MKILFAAPAHIGLLGDAGGVLRAMRLREQSLAARGHEVVYLSPWQRPPWKSLDLCHLFMANGDTYNLGLRIREHLPLVVSPIIDRVQPNFTLRCHVWVERCLPRHYSHLGRCAALCRAADVICLHSAHEENRLRHGLGVRTRCRVVPCPVRLTTEVIARAPKRLAALAQRPFVLFVGDAGNPRKNVVRLVRAVQQTDLELVIAGTLSPGSTREEVLALAERCGRIHLVGFLPQPELNYAFRHARAILLPSLMEGIGLAAAEAALLGTTVVITREGGPYDYFGDDAYYVNPHSVADVRRQILAAVACPRDASARIRRRLGLENTGAMLEACYRDCFGGSAPSRKSA